MEEFPPFTSVTARHGYGSNGVVKINNIPFTVTCQEIARFISPFIKPFDPTIQQKIQGPIHIIMEKPTGKTMDCFVELLNQEAAKECVNRFECGPLLGQNIKIGNRNVVVELSNQAELRKAVFPRSRFVEFDTVTGRPRIMSHQEDLSWSEGFRGYFTDEEIYGVTRFAENPARSPFVLKCNQRVYESMISTLQKFPWPATQTYTVAERDTLFRTTHKLLSILSQKVFAPNNATGQYQREVGLSWALLHDLTYAAIRAPFSLFQKSALLRASGPVGDTVREVTWLAATWPFQTIVPHENTKEDLVEFWLELFDSGFSRIEEEQTATTYNEYMIVRRNDHGYPVTEWTEEGLKLPFEAGVQMEFGVMMLYIDRGRTVWARERALKLENSEANTFMKLMTIMAEEKESSQRSRSSEPETPNRKDSNVSPTTTGFDHQIELLTSNNGDTSAKRDDTSQPGPIITTPAVLPTLNPATAEDFVPASMRGRSTTAPIVSNSQNVIRSIWTDPPVGRALNSRATYPIITPDTANTKAYPHNSHGYTQSASRPTLRNPFPTSLARAPDFSQDHRQEYTQPPTQRSHEVVDPFHQQKRRVSHSMMKLPVDRRSQVSKQGSYSQKSSTTHRDSAFSISNSMCQLSFEAAPRNNSNGNISTTAPTSIFSHRNPSLTVNECGSPVPQSVQKYPNLIYSDVRQRYNMTQADLDRYGPQSSAGHVRVEDHVRGQGRGQGRIMSATCLSGAAPPSQSPKKARAQSTPFGVIGQRTPRAADPQSSYDGLYEDQSFAIITPSASNETTPPVHADVDQDNLEFTLRTRQGRLSSSELWMGLQGTK